eukprot:GDKI01003938.1.p1 GENE.GDKI01003938.1~~GDKI01003938.1.p1  ORF type:complete len:601 (+),score=155.00 GDKI01003938.1:126-1805(+)
MSGDSKPAAGHEAEKLFYTNGFSTFGFIWQLAMIVLFGLFTSYPSGELDRKGENNYPMFQDTHIMMVIGFGFLYTLLKRYAWTGVAYNFIVVVFVLQWAILCQGFWTVVMNARKTEENGSAWETPIPLTMDTLINGDYIVATVLVSFGAMIGRLSALQCLIMGFIETVVATANVIISFELKVYDAGGSMLIHTFGAAFGLAVACAYGDRAKKGEGKGESRLATSRHNGTFAMIGTLFLFAFWPSFNSALLKGEAQSRAVINTTLSICCSAVAAFIVSKAKLHGKHFDMEHVQNSTLAGGVAIGAACDMLKNPWGAMLTGFIAGSVSVLGFSHLTPMLKKKFGVTDTCGIASLHFMPGLIGGVAGAIAMGVMGEPKTEWHGNHHIEEEFIGRIGRTALEQGGYQMAMLIISLVFALVSGFLTGKLLKLDICDPVKTHFYEDAGSWHVPQDASDSEYPETVENGIAVEEGKGVGMGVAASTMKPSHHGQVHRLTTHTGTTQLSTPSITTPTTVQPVPIADSPPPSPPDGAILLKNAGVHSTHLGEALDVHMQVHDAVMSQN